MPCVGNTSFSGLRLHIVTESLLLCRVLRSQTWFEECYIQRNSVIIFFNYLRFSLNFRFMAGLGLQCQNLNLVLMLDNHIYFRGDLVCDAES